MIEIIWLFLGTLIGQIIIFIIGYTFFQIISHKKQFPSLQKFAISYGMGMGLLALTMLLFIILGISARISFLPLIFATIALFYYFKIYKCLKEDIKNILSSFKKLKLNKIEIFCFILIIIIVIIIISRAIIYPIAFMDEWLIWDAKARYLFYDGNFNYITYSAESYHINYPPLVPLINCFFYSIYFTPYHLSKITSAMVYISLVIFIFYTLRGHKLNRTYSILLTTLLAMVSEMFFQAIVIYADLTLTFYFTIGSIFLISYIKTKERLFIIISSIFLGFMALTKQEGIAILAINIGIFVLYEIFMVVKKEQKLKVSFINTISLFIYGFLIYLPWLIFTIFNNISDVYTSNLTNLITPSILFDRIVKILLYVPIALLWCYYWIIFFILLLFFQKSTILKQIPILLLFLCMSQLILYVIIYIISPYDIIWQLSTSINRELLHITPISIILLGLLLVENKQLLFKFKKNKDIEVFIKYLCFALLSFLIIYVIIAYTFNIFFM